MRGASSPTIADQVYRLARSNILSGIYKPGSKLRIERLKSEIGAGASPIREALLRLVGEGLVHLEERRGFSVAGIPQDELEEITKLRIDFECRLLRTAIREGNDEWEAGIVAAHHRLSLLNHTLKSNQSTDDWEARHAELHEALVSASNETWSKRFRGMLYVQSERYRRLSVSQTDIARGVAGEHAAIVEATLSRDADRACRLMAEHIIRTAEIVDRAMSRSDGRQARKRTGRRSAPA